MKNNKKFKRTHYFIDRQFQLKFILNILLIVVIIIALISIFLLSFTSNEMGVSAYSKLLQLKNTRQLMVPVVIKVSIIVLFIGALIVVARFIFVTHRIAGPMFRFRRELKKLGEGDLTISIKFRDGDEMQDIAEILTESVAILNKTISDISKDVNKLDKIVNKAKFTKKEYAEINELIKTLKQHIKKFKLK